MGSDSKIERIRTTSNRAIIFHLRIKENSENYVVEDTKLILGKEIFVFPYNIINLIYIYF